MGVFLHLAILTIKIPSGIGFEPFVVTTVFDFSGFFNRHVHVLPDLNVSQLLLVVGEVELNFFQRSPFGLGQKMINVTEGKHVKHSVKCNQPEQTERRLEIIVRLRCAKGHDVIEPGCDAAGDAPRSEMQQEINLSAARAIQFSHLKGKTSDKSIHGTGIRPKLVKKASP